MFPKPEKKKRKNKHRHVTNKRFKEWTPCWVCLFLNNWDENMARGAYASHEVFFNGASWIRNRSMDYGAKIPICMEHDEEVHRTNSELCLIIQRYWQRKIMNEQGWRIADFYRRFKDNYLDEDWDW